jgi:hypothetical protein
MGAVDAFRLATIRQLDAADTCYVLKPRQPRRTPFLDQVSPVTDGKTITMLTFRPWLGLSYSARP